MREQDALAALVEPIVDRAVAATLARLQESDAKIGDGRLALSERQAAEAIGVPAHVLRDCRFRGELVGRKVGRTTCYAVEELRRFLSEGGAE